MKGQRIGFTLASIHLGSSQSLWASLAAHVLESNDQLFIFPLGRLEYQEESEAMRAGVTSLVNLKNIDGLISWASALGGVVSLNDVIAFHEEHFSDIPYVTIGLKCPGHADISFDAYDGFKGAILHLIKVHGVRKIAFVRGPENHISAEDRYRAYIDSLKECKIDFDARLVSSPFPWSCGEAAIKELVEERGLRPGIDFEALCSASDMMMLSSGRYLERMHVRIPKDLKLIGFNNSSESQLLRVPCTTVSMPYERMGIMAYTLIKGLLNSPKGDFECPDVVLPAELVIRRSCGCTDSFGGKEHASLLIRDRESFKAWANKMFHFTDEERSLVDKAIALSFAYPLLEDEEEDLLLTVAELFEKLLMRQIDVNLIYEALGWFSLINENEDFRSFVSERLLHLVGTSLCRVNLLKEFQEEDKKKSLNRLKCELLSLKTFSDLSRSLAKYLPSLSVSAAFVILKTDDLHSRFVGGFDRERLYTDEIEFEEDLLLPEGITNTLGHGVYIVSELFSENIDLGYLVIRTDNLDGSLSEELRTSLSSAVQGTYLLESSNNARIRAENAEKARSEFFSNVSEDLRDPLLKIKELISSIDGDDDSRRAIAREIAKANHMLDLSLAQTGELELEARLVNLEIIVRSEADRRHVSLEILDRIPLIYFDSGRLKEALELLINLSLDNACPVSLKLKVTRGTISLEIENTDSKLDYRLFLNDASYLLSERIMVMHQGTIIPSLGRITLSFSLPTFSSLSVKEKHGRLLLLGRDEGAFALYDEVVERDGVRNRKRLLEADIAAISWAMDDVSYDVLNLLRTLSRESMLSRVPLYFYGNVEDAFNPVSLIDYMMRDFDTPPVIILGPLPEPLKGVLSEKNTVFIKELGEYDGKESGQDARLLITTKEISAKDIMEFRKNNDVNFNIMIMLGTFSSSYAESICSIPKVLLVNTCIAESEDFISRFNSILAGDEILPAFTGALVKRALGYLVEHATSQITRWQLAESVNVSEDYLTRIFRKELGISPWDYLNRYRIYLASELLRQEAMSVNEVAYRTGFQDQAYFCRVFKKIKGITPGKLRSRT